MPDISHLFGADATTGSTGDFSQVDGVDLGPQRILRRLLTNPNDYVFHPEYGAGLGAMIGKNLDMSSLVSLIRSQIFLENCVAKIPEPTIDANQIQNGVSVDIIYTDATSGKQIALSFDVSE